MDMWTQNKKTSSLIQKKKKKVIKHEMQQVEINRKVSKL
jgi:hypothetical protein